VLVLASGASASSIVFAGIDAEDGGPNVHGPINNYCQLVNSMLDDVDGTKASAPKGIVVLGSKGFGDTTAFWSAIAGCIDDDMEQIGTAAGIAGANLTQFKMIAVASDVANTPFGGLEQSEQDALVARAGEITDHVNAGGALLGFAQSAFSNPYQYVGGVGSLTVEHDDYEDIDPTPAGTARGLTDALDICCWHDYFTTVPSGYEVLAFVAGTNLAAAIGTGSTVAEEICGNGVDDDGDGKVDNADPDCQVVVPEVCDNGVDDNGDGLVDTDDPQCQATEGPAGDPTCSDGADNDSDGLIDAADPDCEAGSNVPKCFGQPATIYRGSGYPGTNVAQNQPMTITGTAGKDVIVTQNGNDVVDGARGNDLICTRGGNDTIRGGAGNDFVNGNTGNDNVAGQAGNDEVLGGPGDDTVNGGAGTDKIRGQDGDDTLNGGDGDEDRVYGDAGRDTLAGNAGVKDQCHGGADVDKTTANGGCEAFSGIP
jgi:Ca2+-binding RTX toxin-like protein